jgi:hypothetical protein
MRRAVLWAVLLVAVGSVLGVSARGEERLAADRPIEEAVDFYVDARLKDAGVQPAAEAGDAELVRRLTLDLVGRIPTAAEARAYVEASDPGKRQALIDRLMTSEGFVRHQANELDSLLMAGTRGSLRDYLARALAENRPWDQIFRELVLADDEAPERAGSAEFLKQRVKDLDRLTNDVSTTFFGVNVSCAKCHDHPRVRDWKQDHFYGMKSFFSRTYAAGKFVGERDYGTVKYLAIGGEERQSRPMFLTGRVVEVPEAKEPSKEEQRAEKKRIAEAQKKKRRPPKPKYSIRAELVEVALRPEERAFFARAIVNRLWHRFYGTGLVMPLDQMHSANPPSHPALLDWLACDLAEHGYDLRRLIRGLVQSRAYARSSKWEAGEAPEARLFAVAAVRPLTPRQLALSMWVATTDPETLSAALPPAELDTKLAALDGRARELAGALARPGEDYQIGVSEALLLSNSTRTKDLLAEGNDRLVGRMLQAADRDERVALAVRNVLSRTPDDDELSLLVDYLAQRDDRPAEACRQLVWALLTSAEFRFNH